VPTNLVAFGTREAFSGLAGHFFRLNALETDLEQFTVIITAM
jgi:hypothetical protein